MNKMNGDNKTGLIVIGAPKLECDNGLARMTSVITVRGDARPVWFEVEERYGQYLCAERSDAFLIGILNYAMREHCDIRCESPVGSQLLYQIRTYLIPSLVRHSKVLYATNIEAEMDLNPIANSGGVGAGVSCGVDSLHVIKNYARSPYPGLSLTHLVLNNVGAFWRGTEDHQYEWQSAHVREFCKENGFELILTNSNIAEQIPQNHFLTHTYSSCFAIYCLQGLWSVYYYGSSGEDFSAFSLVDNDEHDAAHYELLSLDVFSTRNLKIYSEGGAIDRFEKVKDLVGYKPSYKYLHVCTSDGGPNCGHCGKCLRTLTALDALGVLDKYREAFDVEDYKRNHRDRLKWLYLQQIDARGDKMTQSAYHILSEQISLLMRIEARISFFVRRFVFWAKTLAIKALPGFYKLYRKYYRHCSD